MLLEFLLKSVGVLMAAAIGWIIIFVVARTIFIAYFQTKTTFTRPNPHHKKEMNGGQKKD